MRSLSPGLTSVTDHHQENSSLLYFNTTRKEYLLLCAYRENIEIFLATITKFHPKATCCGVPLYNRQLLLIVPRKPFVFGLCPGRIILHLRPNEAEEVEEKKKLENLSYASRKMLSR